MERRTFLKNSAIFSILSQSAPSIWDKAFMPYAQVDITAMSAIELSNAIQNRQVSCMEVMSAYLERIHKYNPVYNAIINMPDDDELLAGAREADEALARNEYRGWMHGMPHAVKDLSAAKGLGFNLGSPIYANRVALEDSYHVRFMRNSGAIFIGKTNVPEFGLGCQTYNNVHGATGSAYNPGLTSGGSSGGAASAVATHMLPVADGGDMMGSLRNPGAYNNVIGFRPSATSFEDPEYRELSNLGPVARNVRDAIKLFHVITDTAEVDYSRKDLKEVRLGWLGDLNGHLPMEKGITGLAEKALKMLEGEGASVEYTGIEMNPEDLWFSWTTLRHSSRFDFLPLYETPETRTKLKPELAWEIEQYLSISEEIYRKAEAIRKRWYLSLDDLFQKYDFLVIPSSQVFPFSKEIHWPKEINGKPMDTYHRWMEVMVPASLGGIPVINLPVGFDSKGRPMGMQVMGNFGKDKDVLEFALAYEQVTDFLNQRPDI